MQTCNAFTGCTQLNKFDLVPEMTERDRDLLNSKLLQNETVHLNPVRTRFTLHSMLVLRFKCFLEIDRQIQIKRLSFYVNCEFYVFFKEKKILRNGNLGLHNKKFCGNCTLISFLPQYLCVLLKS